MTDDVRGTPRGLDILAFGAHPDDVEIGAAGTLLRAGRGGASTGIITLTRGEMSTRGTLAARAAEFDAAAAILGLAHHEMLSLPDGRLSADEASKDAVLREIREHGGLEVMEGHAMMDHVHLCLSERDRSDEGETGDLSSP